MNASMRSEFTGLSNRYARCPTTEGARSLEISRFVAFWTLLSCLMRHSLSDRLAKKRQVLLVSTTCAPPSTVHYDPGLDTRCLERPEATLGFSNPCHSF